QRQVGETALNDTSSRSHQIIRLTIEICLRENSTRVKSFVASLNLVDLAGMLDEGWVIYRSEIQSLPEYCNLHLGVVSEKQLLKNLQNKVALLEAELHSPEPEKVNLLVNYFHP
ncbi:hypothetical protein MKW92_037903, partial [Papaver armeniacum]